MDDGLVAQIERIASLHIAALDQREGVALLIELLLQALAHGAAGLLEPGFGLLRRKLAKQARDRGWVSRHFL